MPATKRLKIDNGLDIRCSSDTPLGQIIDYMQKVPSPYSTRDLAIEMLFARFLPLVLEPSDSSHRLMALECANKCEMWGKLIREHWGLNASSSTFSTVHSIPQVEPDFLLSTKTASSLPSVQTEIVKPKKIIYSAQEFEQMLQKLVDNASGAQDALQKLAKLKPTNEEDWTETQWDLWDDYSNKQQNSLYGQLLAELR